MQLRCQNYYIKHFPGRCFQTAAISVFPSKQETALGRAMAQVVSRCPLTAEARIRAWFSPCGMLREQSDTGTGFSLSYPDLPCQYHPTIVLHAHISSGG
jgi:hypothetical protein